MINEFRIKVNSINAEISYNTVLRNFLLVKQDFTQFNVFSSMCLVVFHNFNLKI